MAIYDLMKLYFAGNQRLLPVHLYGSRETGKAGKGAHSPKDFILLSNYLITQSCGGQSVPHFALECAAQSI